MIEHRNLAGLDALHPFTLQQAGDPGAGLGAGKGWWNTASGQLYIRDDANAAWLDPIAPALAYADQQDATTLASAEGYTDQRETAIRDSIAGYMPLAGGTFGGNVNFLAHNTYDLGLPAAAPRNVYAGTAVVAGADPGGTEALRAASGRFGAAIITPGLVPPADNAYDSGTAAARWRSVFVGTSVVVGSDPGGVAPLRVGGNGVISGFLTAGTGLLVSSGAVSVSNGGITITQGGNLLIEGQDSGATAVRLTSYAGASAFRGRRALGTYAAPLPVNSGTGLVSFIGAGYDTTAFADSASVAVQGSETWTATAHGARIVFFTVGQGTTTAVQRAIVNHDGTWLANTDNTYDHGTSAVRWRSGYFGTSIVVGTDPGGSSAIRTNGLGVFSGGVSIGGKTDLGARYLTVQGSVSGTAGARFVNSGDAGNYLDMFVFGSTGVRVLAATSAGNGANLDLDVAPADGISAGVVRLFRNTTTTGSRVLQFFRGDGSATVDHQIGADTQYTFFGAGQSTQHGANVGIGISAPLAALHIQRSNGVGSAAVWAETLHDTPGTAVSFVMRRGRAGGTTNPATASAVQSGDTIGSVLYQGYDGGSFGTGAAIIVNAAENWLNGTNRGAELSFWTVPLASATPQSRWKVLAAGALIPVTHNSYDIGAVVTAVRSLYLGTSLLVGSNQVVGARKTGWALPTGTLSRATFDQSTVTLPALAQVVAALVTDLYSQHGLIGA